MRALLAIPVCCCLMSLPVGAQENAPTTTAGSNTPAPTPPPTVPNPPTPGPIPARPCLQPLAEQQEPCAQKFDRWQTAQWRIPQPGPTGKGVAFGYEIGIFGNGFGQGLRIKIPFQRYWGAMIRGLSAHSTQGDLLWNLGGRLELFGQSPVYFNLVRLYGGGGVQAFYPIKGPGTNVRWGGGGQFGFEFFSERHSSLFLEVGGSGGGSLTTGATVLAGINLYPFSR